jgi:hypothetical protein
MKSYAEQVAELKTAVFAAVKLQRDVGNIGRGDSRIFVTQAFDDAWPTTKEGKKDGE